MNLTDLSRISLCHFTRNISKQEFDNNLENLWSCKWLDIIDRDVIKRLNDDNLDEIVNNKTEQCFLTGISCFLAFLQENFTGPSLGEEYKKILEDFWPKELNPQDKLKVDGEELASNVKFPEFLLCADIILDKLRNNASNSLVFQIWKMRILCIHQKILDELTATIYEDFKGTINKILAGLDDVKDKELKACILVEICNGFLIFHRTQKSEQYLNDVCRLLDIEVTVEGLLGKRTKFQQKDLPQLCLKVQQNTIDPLSPAAETNGGTKLPRLLKHEDDILLEKIEFKSPEDNETMKLPSVIQAIILAKTRTLLKSQPSDIISQEILEPYIGMLLYQEHGPLTVRLLALLLNVDLEKENNRKVERSLKQCEEVLNIVNNSKEFSVFDRFSYVFQTSFCPRWEIEKKLGDLMISLGLVKTALDTYIKIQSWDEVIECYTRLELRNKAAEIIRQELDKKPTVKLYCLLGDATSDSKYYEEAWKFSNETSSRAQRHWGNFYFMKQEYENCLEHYEKSLEINSLQEGLWLRLGYSAIMLEKWELAVQAYLRYTHLEPNGFESWNNLAKALIKLGDKKRAHKMLSESLKCNYNNWKVWENFMIVSVDIGSFEDVLNSYSRLIELKEKFIDLEVLEIVVTAISKNITDNNGRPSNRLQKKAITLLGHQCIQHGNETKVWELAAIIADTSLSRAHKYQKSYQAYMQRDPQWFSIKDSSLKVMELCRSLCENALEAIDNYGETEKSVAVSQLSSARLAVQACIRVAEKNNEQWPETEEVLEELRDFYKKITEKLKAVM